MIRVAAAASVLALSLAAPASAADGQQLFNMQCKMCHTGGPMGPSLTGVAGAKIASKEGFAYSPALKAKGGTWTDANLDAFLKAPAQFAPGTKMMMNVASDESRVAIIGYLKTLK
ncbi:c-type cytochrome [Phenylobacterium sp. J426]|uniref:c-type cytochrome n=1 Tax=Phenylobacterium sp. J426 TaxID=2898439 RepID=UPI002150CFB8|nr:c-type cytochrome [Phenylobacterium sp. J426]MCR5873555.1 c-type cytochrome [Phenylobacterium sp. J426]